jgi:hypothetical protein
MFLSFMSVSSDRLIQFAPVLAAPHDHFHNPRRNTLGSALESYFFLSRRSIKTAPRFLSLWTGLLPLMQLDKHFSFQIELSLHN